LSTTTTNSSLACDVTLVPTPRASVISRGFSQYRVWGSATNLVAVQFVLVCTQSSGGTAEPAIVTTTTTTTTLFFEIHRRQRCILPTRRTISTAKETPRKQRFGFCFCYKCHVARLAAVQESSDSPYAFYERVFCHWYPYYDQVLCWHSPGIHVARSSRGQESVAYWYIGYVCALPFIGHSPDAVASGALEKSISGV
jgi:hypothetical protein